MRQEIPAEVSVALLLAEVEDRDYEGYRLALNKVFGELREVRREVEHLRTGMLVTGEREPEEAMRAHFYPSLIK